MLQQHESKSKSEWYKSKSKSEWYESKSKSEWYKFTYFCQSMFLSKHVYFWQSIVEIMLQHPMTIGGIIKTMSKH